MNRRVEFRDIDMNQHYTVEMNRRAVGGRRAAHGAERLVARQLYYKRNLFGEDPVHVPQGAPLGDRAYFIKTKITKVTGSLMDIRVAFLDERETLCFEILWTILHRAGLERARVAGLENVDLMEHAGCASRADGKSRDHPDSRRGQQRAKTSEKDERENETRA